MVPAAVGMNSTEYKGRPGCIYDGWCHVGCPIGALANPLVTYLGDARKAGAEVRPWSTVTRVLTNGQGTRVIGVEYYDRNKERQVQQANVVVLAAWAAQNPRPAAQLGDRQAPEGVGQFERPRRQIHDDPLRLWDLGDFRRGYRKPHGHHRRPIHVLRPLRQDEPQGRVRQLVHRCRRRLEDQRARRLCQRPARPVRERSCSAPSAGSAASGRSAKNRRISRTASS